MAESRPFICTAFSSERLGKVAQLAIINPHLWLAALSEKFCFCVTCLELTALGQVLELRVMQDLQPSNNDGLLILPGHIRELSRAHIRYLPLAKVGRFLNNQACDSDLL